MSNKNNKTGVFIIGTFLGFRITEQEIGEEVKVKKEIGVGVFVANGFGGLSQKEIIVNCSRLDQEEESLIEVLNNFRNKEVMIKVDPKPWKMGERYGLSFFIDDITDIYLNE